MCLSHITDNGVKYQDLEFVDALTRKKSVYQARVYTGTIRLKSGFSNSSTNTVNLSIWFQDDIPYPGVDLAVLKPQTEDLYPDETREGLKSGAFATLFQKVV